LWDHLTVWVSSDEFNAIKNKQSFYSYEERRHLLEAIKYIDEIIPENDWDQKESDIKKRNIDVLVMGDDWQWKFDHLKQYCEVIYLPRTPDISTTQLKKGLKWINDKNLEMLEDILVSLNEFRKILN
jgi:glycerol-3-phosphate cytidylyltransferase